MSKLALMACILLFSSNGIAQQITKITLYNSDSKMQIPIQYDSDVRLAQILADSVINAPKLISSDSPLGNKAIYWTGAGLFYSTLDEHNTEQTQLVIHRFKLLSRNPKLSIEQQEAAKALADWLDTQQFRKRINVELNYDLVRLRDHLNPLLSGNYLLSMSSKPNTILVLGAVKKAGVSTFIPRRSSKEYISLAQPTSHSEGDFTTVLQPDGVVQQHPIALWNQQHFDVAPGAIIYHSFTDLPSEYKELNAQTVELLKNWVR